MLGALVPIVFFTFLSDSPPPTPTSNFVCIVLYIWHVAPTCLCPKAVHTPLCSIVKDFYTLRHFLLLVVYLPPSSCHLPLSLPPPPPPPPPTTHFPIAHICVFSSFTFTIHHVPLFYFHAPFLCLPWAHAHHCLLVAFSIHLYPWFFGIKFGLTQLYRCSNINDIVIRSK
jgi:hypothetical protein